MGKFIESNYLKLGGTRSCQQWFNLNNKQAYIFWLATHHGQNYLLFARFELILLEISRTRKIDILMEVLLGNLVNLELQNKMLPIDEIERKIS